jgi:hypothetical protein
MKLQTHPDCADRPLITRRSEGWNGKVYDRGHLVAAQLGGSNSIADRGNFVMIPKRTNNPGMTNFENKVRSATDSGESVEYRVRAIYTNGTSPVPSLIIMEAKGDGSLNLPTLQLPVV